MNDTSKPLVGISACLLGEAVRYDGGSKLDRYLRDVLGNCVEYISICPEAESGMGIPRPAMHLFDDGSDIRLLTIRSREDVTDTMQTWMRGRLAELNNILLCGYIFKSRSPSCGLRKVKLYREDKVTRNGTGLFARGLTDRFPLLPVEEEGRLNDARLRENFIERIFTVQRWHELNAGRKSLKKLMDFHARHKYLLMAHCPKTLASLGAYLANSRQLSMSLVYTEYYEGLMTALGKLTTVRKNTNVLQHIMGYFKKDLSGDEKAELSGIIKYYKQGHVPLIVPITLLNHYVRKYNSPYLEQQYYLNPHPLELKLRNHV